MDNHTSEQRHRNMVNIKSVSSLEDKVRKYLFSKGFRYRKHDRRYPGHPDIILPKYHTVIFINGCFWHQHPGCSRATVPKTNLEYWETKLRRNKERDEENCRILKEKGWNVVVLWECELTNKRFEETLLLLENNLRSLA